MSATVLRDASGAPTGVQITWNRVDDADATGYFIYRDTSSLPAGNPAGNEGKRINGGAKVNDGNPGTGTEEQSFDDLFTPAIGTQYFYRMTVVNSTDDESDFSAELDITISAHEVTGLSTGPFSIGDTLTITGSFFGDSQQAGDKVFFSDSDGNVDIEAASYTSWSADEIVVTVPYGAADGFVEVEIDTVGVTSSTEIDYNEPDMTSIAPNEDWVQNQYIVITGTDFGPAPSSGGTATSVTFGGTAAQTADFDEGNWTTTEIHVKVPAAATGTTVSVQVNVAGNLSNTLNFTILPHIDSIDTASGQTGATRTITGTNFGASQGAGKVQVNGVDASVSVWSNTSVTFDVPAGAIDGDVVLTRDDAEITNGIGFDVVPTLSGLSPARAEVGENVTISGTGFGDSRGTSTVTFENGSVEAASYVSWSSTEIIVEVPAGAKSGSVIVNIADADITGGSDVDSVSSTDEVRVILPEPTITDVGQI